MPRYRDIRGGGRTSRVIRGTGDELGGTGLLDLMVEVCLEEGTAGRDEVAAGQEEVAAGRKEVAAG